MASVALCLGACGSDPHVATSDAVGAGLAIAAADPVTVSPLPGTPDAAPRSQVSFLGGAGTRVGRVRVRGSASGLHHGVLRAYSTGTGESFLPSRPFAPGERVTVSARVVAGPERGRVARTVFTIAVPAPVPQNGWPSNGGSAAAVQHYVSAPGLSPSTVRIRTPPGPGAAPGYLFLAPYRGAGEPGPMIADQHGGLVWFQPLPPGEAATNLAPQLWHGRPVLVWWQGRTLRVGFGEGEDLVVDESYRRLATIRAGNGYSADLHVIRLTAQDTAWIDAYTLTRMNLAGVGGAAKGVLNDAVIQEVDVPTGLVMWEWHAFGHIPFGESKNAVPHSSYPWDFAHVNSLDPGPRGDLLVSFRNTWSLDDIDVRTGAVRWRIGGRNSNFTLARAVKFYWQHDAAFQPDGTISLFDNGSNPPKEPASRGLVLAVEPAARKVHLRSQFVHPSRKLLASSQGSLQSLPGGDWLMGYGGLPDFTEFSSTGRVLLDGTLGPGVESFRAAIARWRGRPTTPPSLVASGGGLAVSWNGATEVAGWRLLTGATPGALRVQATVPRSGFQTSLPAPAGSYAVAQALDAAGQVIGSSRPLAVR